VLIRGVAVPQHPRDRRLIAITGVMLFTVNYALLYWGAQHVSSGLMAVLQAITPAFALLIAQYLLPDERITARKALGLLLGIGGVALIFADELRVSGPLAATACLAVVVSAFFVAWAYVLVRARGGHLPSTTLMTGQIACGLMPLVLVAVVREGDPLAVRWTPPAVVSVFYLAILGSIVAFRLNYWLMKRIGATRMLLTSILEPVLAVILGALILHERLSERVALGGALVLVSVALVMPRDPQVGRDSAKCR
jgi:drug/metabolite transporter (DMT)-like permease